MRAPTKEFTDAQKLLARCPEVKAYAVTPAHWVQTVKESRSVPVIQAHLSGLDMRIAKTFEIPKELSLDPQVVSSKGATLARAVHGPVVWRDRSDIAKEAFNELYEALPEDEQRRVEAVVTTTAQVSGGAEFTLGRFEASYPRVGRPQTAPVTREEALLACYNTGFTMNEQEMLKVRPYPLVMREEEQGLYVNPKSDNGFPIGKKWSDPEARTRCLRMAITTRREIVEASRVPGGVAAWKRLKEREQPWLVAVQGKGKEDVYKLDKIWAKKLRFYNVYPRHINLNVAVAVQPLLSVKRNVLNANVHNTSGITLVRGGAHKLVIKLQQMLDDNGYAYVTQGDDTWLIFLGPDGLIIMMALDGTSFDLCQDGDNNEEIHNVLHEQLARIDKPAADLWLAFMRSRLTVVASTTVRLLRHAHPSGGMAVSEVNNMKEDVACQRVIRGWMQMEEITEQAFEDLVKGVGDGLGLVLRLEQFSMTKAATIAEALAKRSFLFVGNEFYSTDGEEVMVHCDLPRFCAGVPFPTASWATKGREFEVTEAIRLASLALGMGIPRAPLLAAFAAFRRYALELVDNAIVKYPDHVDHTYEFAIADNPLGFKVDVASLKGVRGALLRLPRELWLLPIDADLTEDRGADKERDWMAVPEPLSWADQTDQEEEEERRLLGIPDPPLANPVKLHPMRYIGSALPRSTTHPATERNDGRPPPSVVWGASKPKTRKKVAASSRVVRAGKRGKVNQDDEEEYLEYTREQEDRQEREAPDSPLVEVIEQDQAEELQNAGAWTFRRTRGVDAFSAGISYPSER